jgi:hypothetical protein
MDPSRRGHLRHQILRVLDIVLERRDEGRVLLGEEFLRDSAALLALTHLLTVNEIALYIRIATASAHVRNTEEGTSLRTDIAAIVLELGLIAEHGIHVNLLIVVSVTLLRIDQQLLCTERIHLTGIGDQIGCHVGTRANGLSEIGLNTAKIIACVSQTVNLERISGLNLGHLLSDHEGGKKVARSRNSYETDSPF